MFVVTGGGSGIGRELAHALASREKPVLIVGRREEPLKTTAAFSKNISYLCANVATPEGRELIAAFLSETATIAGLIHNAGIIEPIAPITKIESGAWHNIMSTNLDAPLFLTQILKDKLKGGRVLNIGSGAAHFPVKGWTGYCVSKAALSMLTRCWQLESTDIAFASVMPGIIDTDMQAIIRKASFMDQTKSEFFKALKARQQLILPETVAVFLCWLLLDLEQARYVSEEWDIYNEALHPEWLVPPHLVPKWEEA